MERYQRRMERNLSPDYTINEARFLRARPDCRQADPFGEVNQLGRAGQAFQAALDSMSGLNTADYLNGSHGPQIYEHSLYLDYYSLWDHGRTMGLVDRLGPRQAVRELYGNLVWLHDRFCPQGFDTASLTTDRLAELAIGLMAENLSVPEFRGKTLEQAFADYRLAEKLERHYPYWASVPENILPNDLNLLNQAGHGIRAEYWDLDRVGHDNLNCEPDLLYAYIIFSQVRDRDLIHRYIDIVSAGIPQGDPTDDKVGIGLTACAVADASLGSRKFLDMHRRQLEHWSLTPTIDQLDPEPSAG
jgi:hypothetical protein